MNTKYIIEKATVEIRVNNIKIEKDFYYDGLIFDLNYGDVDILESFETLADCQEYFEKHYKNTDIEFFQGLSGKLAYFLCTEYRISEIELDKDDEIEDSKTLQFSHNESQDYIDEYIEKYSN